MRKFFTLALLFGLFIISASATRVSAVENIDCKLFNFTSENDITGFIDGKNAVSLSLEDSYMRIDFTGEDNPLLYTVLDKSSRFGIKDYPVIKIKYYTNSLDDIMILYYGFVEKATGDNPLDIDPKQAYSADITRGSWSEVTVDLSKIRTNNTLMTLRIDPVGCVFYNNDVFCIEYIGFFKTVADADAYKTDDRQIPPVTERACEETIAFPAFDLSEVDYDSVTAAVTTAVSDTDTHADSSGVAISDDVSDGGNGNVLYYIIGTFAAVGITAAVIAVMKSRLNRGSNNAKG